MKVPGLQLTDFRIDTVDDLYRTVRVPAAAELALEGLTNQQNLVRIRIAVSREQLELMLRKITEAIWRDDELSYDEPSEDASIPFPQR